MIRAILLTGGIFLFCAQLSAQSSNPPMKLSGQIRVRSEADGRDFNSNSDINTFTLLRSRFGAEIEPLQDVHVFFQIQDSRAFGLEPSTLSNTANLDVHQAFFSIMNLWNKPIHLKAGRQEMIYGGERLIGAVGWSNVGRSFDGIKWTIGRTNQFDFFGTIITESTTPGAIPGREDADNRFFGAYYKHRSKPGYTLDVYGLYESNLNETVAGKNDMDRATIGTYNRGTLSSNVAFETEVAVQLGKRRGQDVRAFMLTGSLNYTFPSTRRPSLLIGYDYLSGMDQNDEKYKVFDTLFATNHKFYGFMDYFVNIPVNTNGQGLQDLMLKARIPLSSKWNFNAHFHNFRAAKGTVKNFGNEVDLVLNYKYNSAASFVLGLGIFAPGDLVKQRFGAGDVGIWSYSTLLVGF